MSVKANKFATAMTATATAIAMTAAIATAMTATVAQAQEVSPIASGVATETAIVTAMSPELANSFIAICASTAILSDNARLACFNETAPKVAKSGATFRNTGIGAEFNTLIRNMAAIVG